MHHLWWSNIGSASHGQPKYRTCSGVYLVLPAPARVEEHLCVQVYCRILINNPPHMKKFFNPKLERVTNQDPRIARSCPKRNPPTIGTPRQTPRHRLGAHHAKAHQRQEEHRGDREPAGDRRSLGARSLCFRDVVYTFVSNMCRGFTEICGNQSFIGRSLK